METIFGHSLEEIKNAQQKTGSLHRSINLNMSGDYGADPIGDGNFRMVPSGDIVDYQERCKRLKK